MQMRVAFLGMTSPSDPIWAALFLLLPLPFYSTQNSSAFALVFPYPKTSASSTSLFRNNFSVQPSI